MSGKYCVIFWQPVFLQTQFILSMHVSFSRWNILWEKIICCFDSEFLFLFLRVYFGEVRFQELGEGNKCLPSRIFGHAVVCLYFIVTNVKVFLDNITWHSLFIFILYKRVWGLLTA